jgi:hypothetical protein
LIRDIQSRDLGSADYDVLLQLDQRGAATSLPQHLLQLLPPGLVPLLLRLMHP